MSLVLTLENGPRGQARRNARLDRGELVIGRSPEADWQIDDPDMFVSRAHCRIHGGPEGYFVTDTSSSGLFIDESGQPLGAGNSTRLQSGMRLRLGDYVLGVEMENAVAAAGGTLPPPPPANTSRAPVSFGGDDFFAMRTPEEPKAPRPASLPNPFEQPEAGAFAAADRAENPRNLPPAFDDPFSLDPLPAAAPTPEAFPAAPRAPGPPSFSADFDPFGLQPAAAEAPPAREARDPFGFERTDASAPPPVQAKHEAPAHPPWMEPPEEEAAAPVARAIPPPLPAAPRSEPPPAPRDRNPPPRPEPARARPAAPAPQAAGDEALRDAFLRGLGLDPQDFPTRDAVAEMERLGLEYRLMMEGLMQLLRKRAEEKGNARVAQTVVTASEVNPLKFLPTVGDALSTILADRSPGFLRGDSAITDAVRDLAQHHVRAWRGIQQALRRMVDRFDPAAIEKELEAGSTVGTLLSGGRSAMLWKLYAKRHREIATNAESRFMGDVGADFRDAYEED